MNFATLKEIVFGAHGSSEVEESSKIPSDAQMPMFGAVEVQLPERVQQHLFRHQGEALTTLPKMLWVENAPKGSTVYEDVGMFKSEKEFLDFCAWTEKWLPSFAAKLKEQKLFLVACDQLNAKISTFYPDEKYSKAEARSGEVVTVAAPHDRYCLVGLSAESAFDDSTSVMRVSYKSSDGNASAPRADWVFATHD